VALQGAFLMNYPAALTQLIPKVIIIRDDEKLAAVAGGGAQGILKREWSHAFTSLEPGNLKTHNF